MRNRGLGVALMALLCTVGTGCATQAPTPSHAPATAVASPVTESSDAFVLPEPRGDAIAHATISEGASEATSSDGAEKGVTYVVHAACDGNTSDTMSYSLFVDGVEVGSSTTWSCRANIVNPGFEAEGGEVVGIVLLTHTATGDFLSFAEVVPSP